MPEKRDIQKKISFEQTISCLVSMPNWIVHGKTEFRQKDETFQNLQALGWDRWLGFLQVWKTPKNGR